MAKSKGIKSNIIRGPIGMGTPFKHVYNSDGTPNYVLATQKQKEASLNSPQNVVRNNAKMQDKGKEYVSNYVKELRSGIANVQKLLNEQSNHISVSNPQKGNPQYVPNRDIKKTTPVQQVTTNKHNHIKQPVKNEPTIKR